MAILVIPLTSLFLLGKNVINVSSYQTTAIALAQGGIEEIKAIPLEDLQGMGNQNIQECVLIKGIDFKKTTILEWQEDLVKITVKLSWEGRSIVLVTYRGRH